MTKTIKLCGKARCCPVLTIDDNEIIIEDDFGGSVVMTKEEFEELKEVELE